MITMLGARISVVLCRSFLGAILVEIKRRSWNPVGAFDRMRRGGSVRGVHFSFRPVRFNDERLSITALQLSGAACAR